MVRPIDVAMFCEDVAHERFVGALVVRVACEEGRTVHVRSISARGGHGRALDEFRVFQKAQKGDLALVAIDANCKGWNHVSNDIDAIVDASKWTCRVIACPDPHIERWYLADPPSLKRALGVSYTSSKAKCERDLYKQHLRHALEVAGHTVTLGGAEFAQEIVESMDLYHAGRNEPSLKYCVDSLREAMRTLR